MAIPVAILTAVIKKSEIEASYPGGLHQFLRDQPDASEDEHLFGVSFMSGGDLQEFIDSLGAKGVDVRVGLAIGEQFRGEWQSCEGIEFVAMQPGKPFSRWEARVAGTQEQSPRARATP